MFSRIRSKKTVLNYEEERSIQGVGSLLGGDGVSLNGESVQLPSEYDINGDEILSVNTSNYEGRLKASGAANGGGMPPKKTGFATEDTEDDDGEEEKSKTGAAAEAGCLPLWITNAPLWLKSFIALSTALLVGAIVLLAVAAGLSASSSSDTTGTSASLGGSDSNTDITLSPESVVSLTSQPSSAPFLPTSLNSTASNEPTSEPTTSKQPTLRPTLLPTNSSLVSPSNFPTSTPSTSMPTFLGQTYEPTSTPTTALPSFQPSTLEPSVQPTPVPIVTPSEVPSELPSSSPSLNPSVEPSEIPSSHESSTPTMSFRPSTRITDAPTDVPSSLPTVQTTTVFYLAAGRLVTDVLDQYEELLPTLPTNEDSFMVHLGDWNSPLTTGCDEQSYITVDELYSTSSVPVYFIPGDNEYNDCPDPDAALDLWYQYLLEYETKYWPEPSFTVERDRPDYPENFAFLLRNVLYVGINLVGGLIHDEASWELRHEANLNWIDEQYYDNLPDLDVLVVLAHADPDVQSNNAFYTPFLERVRDEYDVPTILIHRNLGVESWGVEQNFGGIDNFVVLVAQASLWPPMRVEIDTIRGVFSFDQDSWYDDQL